MADNVVGDVGASGKQRKQFLTIIGVGVVVSWYGAVLHMTGELIWGLCIDELLQPVVLLVELSAEMLNYKMTLGQTTSCPSHHQLSKTGRHVVQIRIQQIHI